MAQYGLHINKRSKRALDGPNSDQRYILFTFEDPKDKVYSFVRANVSHAEAWLWFRGDDPIPEIAPTVDEMLDAIAFKLQADINNIMLMCSENEGWLRDLYSRTKESRSAIAPPWR